MKSTRSSKPGEREINPSTPPEIPPPGPIEVNEPDENPSQDDQPRSRESSTIPGEGPNPTPPEVK